ncbi:MAG: NADH:ubiquinone reductase (Na(+)-transporting) subunit D, partial [Pseudomonadota bacterium]|nr:NADH:ubiquinone reductase (Na(+)-transporting) subunit D [Pseudomonadota bacterium]
FFLIGFLIWVIRAAQTEQVEEPEFKIAEHTAAEEGA